MAGFWQSYVIPTFRTWDMVDEGLLGFYLPGEIIGFDAIHEKTHKANVVALDTSSVCGLSFDSVSEMARQLPALQEEIKRLRKLAQTEGYFLQQNTAALSAAQIQERVAEMVTAQGGEIRSVQVAQEQTENGFTRVSVKVRMQAFALDWDFTLEERLSGDAWYPVLEPAGDSISHAKRMPISPGRNSGPCYSIGKPICSSRCGT